MNNINKQKFLNTLFCPTYGWLLSKDQIPKSKSTGDLLRIEEGNEIHKRARNLFPNGILVDDINIFSAKNKTTELLSNKNTSVIFHNDPLIFQRDEL